MGCWQKQQDSKPSASIPNSTTFRPSSHDSSCSLPSHIVLPAPFRLQNIVDLQLATFQRIIFFGLVHSLLWISHFYFFFDFAPRTPYLFTNLCVTYFPRAELADSHATLSWDAQKSCAQTIGANVLQLFAVNVIQRHPTIAILQRNNVRQIREV